MRFFDNLELRALVQADQDERKDWAKLTTEQKEELSRRDAVRLARVKEILKEGSLNTAADFSAAGLIFQHGTTPEDYLVAHELALCAWLLGHFSSLTGLAEDRYLQSIKRVQRFGSQFNIKRGDDYFPSPVEENSPAAVTDYLRRDYIMPTLAEARRWGIRAAMAEETIRSAVNRYEERTDPNWQARQDARPKAQELAKLAAHPGEVAIKRVLVLYKIDELKTPTDYRNAATVLLTASDPSALALAHELAIVAAVRKDQPSRRLTAMAWDKFLAKIGQKPRYGTLPGHPANTDAVSPAVLRLLDCGKD